MTMSLRKSCSEDSAPSPPWKSQTLLAHCSKSGSWVTPRSSVMASYSVRPGDLRLLLGSPPSRCFTTSVVRLSELTLLTPATYLLSHFTRNLKFLYGSKRSALTVNCAIGVSLSLGWPRHEQDLNLDLNLTGYLLELEHHKLRGFEWREAYDDVDDPEIDIVLRRGLFIALYKIGVARRGSLESALPKQVVHESADVEPYLRPERFVVW